MKRQNASGSGINRSKRFVAIGKVKDAAGFRFVKYRFNSIEKFLPWFTSTFNVCWFNVYSNRGETKRQIVATWGNKKGLLYQ